MNAGRARGSILGSRETAGALSVAGVSGGVVLQGGGAHLNGVDLTDATVSQEQLDKACGTEAKLNTGLDTQAVPILTVVRQAAKPGAPLTPVGLRFSAIAVFPQSRGCPAGMHSQRGL
jgi:hypothetical protein